MIKSEPPSPTIPLTSSTYGTINAPSSPHTTTHEPSPRPSTNLASSSSKTPPCDQCRRRKVRCDAGAPCDRCVRSDLRCTREIIRKRRGPKKGSGSVIAKLRNEDGTAKTNGIDLPSYGVLPMDIQNAASSSNSPLVSPISGHFQAFGPTFGPSVAITPFSNESEIWARGHMPLQYSSPESPEGYLSVSELARRIFKAENTGPVTPPIIHPNGTESPSTSTHSPMLNDGPRFLHQSNSSTPGVPHKITTLAAEVSMSPLLMSQCIKQYFKHLYPIMPMIHQPSFNLQLHRNDSFGPEEKCLLLSLCAITVLHAAPPSDINLETKKDLGRKLVNSCLSIRSTFDWIEQATLTTIITSFFISLSYFDLKQPRSHLFYLRESIGLALEQGLQRPPPLGMDKIDRICANRLFALLFVTERGYAILRNKPIIISRLPTLPVENFDDESHPEILTGFQCICRLFALLDETFVELWGNSSIVLEDATVVLEDVAAIQQNLTNFTLIDTQLTEIQTADVLITQQWLRLIFWQASMRHGLVSSSTREEYFSYDYPLVVAQALCRVMQQISLEAILVHGLGIFEKIFEVAYTLMDALTLRRSPWSESAELQYLFSCLSASPNSHHTYVRILESKMNPEDDAILHGQGPVGQADLNHVCNP